MICYLIKKMLSKNSRAIFDDPQDEIVISGMSGRFPNSNNVKEFEHKLYNKIDCVDDDDSRWAHVHPEIPRRAGKVLRIEKFDAAFFGYPSRHVQALDPQMRFLLEHTFEAILDAGLSPRSIRGSNTGVFVGNCFNENEKVSLYDASGKEGGGLSG